MGYLVTAKDYSKSYNYLQQLYKISYLVIITFITLCGIGFFVYLNYLLRPLSNIVEAIKHISAGQVKNITIDGLDRSDEIGLVARSVEMSRHNIIKLKQVEESRQKLYIQQNEKVKSQIKTLSDSLEKEINTTAQQVISYAQNTLDHAGNVSPHFN